MNVSFVRRISIRRNLVDGKMTQIQRESAFDTLRGSPVHQRVAVGFTGFIRSEKSLIDSLLYAGIVSG